MLLGQNVLLFGQFCCYDTRCNTCRNCNKCNKYNTCNTCTKCITYKKHNRCNKYDKYMKCIIRIDATGRRFLDHSRHQVWTSSFPPLMSPEAKLRYDYIPAWSGHLVDSCQAVGNVCGFQTSGRGTNLWKFACHLGLHESRGRHPANAFVHNFSTSSMFDRLHLIN